MTWTEIPITGGVVKTRNPSALEPGELVGASNCRLKKNDLKQLHSDLYPSSVGTASVVAGPYYLSFEGSADQIMVITSSDIMTARPSVGSFSSIQAFSGTPTKAAVVHRGNEYFVGTDAENYVIKDNVARPLGMDGTTLAVSISNLVIQNTSGSDSGLEYGDEFFVWVTEYDSDNDVESEPRSVGYDRFGSVQDGYYVRLTLPSVSNSEADKFRIYYSYIGNSGATVSAADIQKTQTYQDRREVFNNADDRLVIAGLLDEIATGYVDPDYGAGYYSFQPLKSNPSYPYPLLYSDPLTGGSLNRYLVKPADFTLGVLFQDSLVVNDPGTSKQIIRYSPPGEPEYQPTPYFMYFASEASDEIVGLHSVGNTLLVLSTGGVHRVNYLPLAGRLTQNQGRAQEVLTERVGCVGRKASVKVETSQGEMCVWLSRRGLEWSDGRVWDDACPDFQTSDLSGTLSDAVLVNDGANYRVRLYSGTEVWDFYYHPSHRKNGRMKLMGPSTYPHTVIGAATGPLSDVDYVWTSSSSAVYKESSTNTQDSVITTGQLTAGPFTDLRIQATGLTHTAAANRSFKARAYTKLRGYAELTKGQKTIGGNEYDETGRVETPGVGQYVRSEITVAGTGSWSAGPVWLDLEVSGGDNG